MATQETRTPHVSTETPTELFTELVHGAMDHQKVPWREGAPYLVQLLEGFVCPTQLHQRTETLPDRPVAEIFCLAIESHGMRQLALLKLAGDLSLFIAGFLPASVEGRGVDAPYYRQIGGVAYSTAAGTCHSTEAAHVFQRLSTDFATCVDVLNEVSEQCAVSDPPALLVLHRRWTELGSPRSARELARRGIVPMPGDEQVH